MGVLAERQQVHDCSRLITHSSHPPLQLAEYVQTLEQGILLSDYPILSLLKTKLDPLLDNMSSQFAHKINSRLTGLEADRQSALTEINRLKVCVQVARPAWDI